MSVRSSTTIFITNLPHLEMNIMKNIIHFLFFAVVFFSTPYTMAEWDKDYTDRMFRERFEPFRTTMNDNVKIYNGRLEGIDKSITELEATVKKLKSAIESLSERVSDLDGKPPITYGSLLPAWVLAIIVLVCLIVVFFVFLLFWPQKKECRSVPKDSSSRPKCPRCGWEHDPDDTVCKNPVCKTHF